ncbi:MAG: tRNA pseudouridine(55) synthase TruB [Flavobacteriaceae bacterium]|nr:tRNA pseudouridine(55) synthase TruB [Flavobacteriaceae bacterium]
MKKNKLRKEFLEGKIILINKPLNWTSFQVVNKIRWLIKTKLEINKIKVGHAGTLDPLAEGLLIICTGRLTKSINKFQNEDKSYDGIITLGSTTPSYDLETLFNGKFNYKHINEKLIFLTKEKFLGKIKQYPPVFSAIKKNGIRLYNYARENKKINISARTIEIKNFELLKIKLPDIKFSITCSKGTYIRSIAHDFGKKLKSGSHLSKLCRTKIGSYSLKDAQNIEDFEKSFK